MEWRAIDWGRVIPFGVIFYLLSSPADCAPGMPVALQYAWIGGAYLFSDWLVERLASDDHTEG